MIDPAYVRRMARYNRWQNRNLYGVADALSDDERRRERGAFFGSIHGTLNHLAWGDRMWMSRFAAVTRPAVGVKGSVSLHETWDDLKRERAALDETIIVWATASTRRGSTATSPISPAPRSATWCSRNGSP